MAMKGVGRLGCIHKRVDKKRKEKKIKITPVATIGVNVSPLTQCWSRLCMMQLKVFYLFGRWARMVLAIESCSEGVGGDKWPRSMSRRRRCQRQWSHHAWQRWQSQHAKDRYHSMAKTTTTTWPRYRWRPSKYGHGEKKKKKKKKNN